MMDLAEFGATFLALGPPAILLGAAALGLYAMLVTPYYLVLAGVGIHVRFRNSRAEERRGG